MEEMSGSFKNLTFDKDRISSLPNDVIDMILVRLLLKDAIRTSLLSRDWRYKWRSMPDLIFHSDSFPSKGMFGKVNKVLLLHKGNIRKFEFSRLVDISSEMDIWLDHLVGMHVQELVLSFELDYLIPFTVFCFDKLITLNLKWCEIRLPSSFDGFKSLTSLVLESITFINDNALVSLIQLCPLLKHLTIKDCDRHRLELHAPNLQSLSIDGSFQYLSLSETSMITTASLFRRNRFDYDLTNILGSLSNVGDLTFLGSYHSSFMGIDYNSSIQEIKFNRLKKLHLNVNLHCSNESAIVCCILKNSPAMGYLHITSWKVRGSLPSYRLWAEPDNISFNFDHLKSFYIDKVFGSKSEMRFIKFILGNAPLLEAYNIKLEWDSVPDGEDETDILREMLSFKRLTSAKVICQGEGME